MPLIRNNDLPAFDALSNEGMTVLTPERAQAQEIRELHFGLLNMMPDAAVEATERQFLRLIGSSSPVAQLNVHLFTLGELERSHAVREHMRRFYEPWSAVRAQGLDGLIISGANVVGSDLSQEGFWQPLTEVLDWAEQSVTSILCSCLATHAVMQYRYGVTRTPLPAKRWGVYSHRVGAFYHPLTAGTDTRFNAPHSRYNDIPARDFERAGLRVLVQGSEAGVHLAVSPDNYKYVLLQGHPEYDTVSLTKEYKREVVRYFQRERDDYPPFPVNCFDARTGAILEEYRDRVERSRNDQQALPDFPEVLVRERLVNTWTDTACKVMSNWVGMVYQLTNARRDLPLMDGLDPSDPLGLMATNQSR